MKLMEPGTYTGTLENYAINTTKDGNPQIALLFGIDVDGGHKQLTWYGTLKEGKGRDITLKTLLNCGLRGNDIAAVAGGADGHALQNGIKMSLVVEHHSYNNKTSEKISWVNALGGSAFQKAMNVQEAKTKLSLLNLGGEVEMLRRETGISKPPAMASTTPQEDDLPF